MSPALLAAWLAAAPALATDVYINVGGASSDSSLLLGLPAFIALDPASTEDAALASRLREVTRQDLLFSRYFRVQEQGPAFTGDNAGEISGPWKAGGAAWLVLARAGRSGPQATVTLRLMNLLSGEAVLERFYRQDARFERSLSHRIADDIVQAATGKHGIARTQIAFSSLVSGRKEIHLVDYDGENLRTVTQDRSIALLPRLSPARKELVYTSWKAGNPDLYALSLETGKTRTVSREQGLNIAGGFSPDGTLLLVTLSRQKDPNIYVKNLSDGSLSRLTQHYGVDSSPTFSPDGSEVAFVSDRSGNPQVYLINATTHRTRRLTHQMNWCDSPAWSPTGEWIAFSGRLAPKDPIDIFIVDVTGNQVRQLTTGQGSNENPSWSPDGRFIAFTSTRGRRPELYMMDADGSAPHRVTELPGGVYTPHWGP